MSIEIVSNNGADLIPGDTPSWTSICAAGVYSIDRSRIDITPYAHHHGRRSRMSTRSTTLRRLY